ncbi:MAG: PEGA domain-containing protein [Polyangiaceae bacterium]|nr:PEGA domain-containing protein [Polyangiaceae bacterium]
MNAHTTGAPTRRRGGRLAAVLAALACSLSTGLAAAQPADPEGEGKRFAKDALEAYQAQEFDKARGLFEQARELYPTGQVLRMTGYTYLALKSWAEAADAIEAALKATYKPLSDTDRTDAEGQLAVALKHLGTVSVKSKVAGATVRVDGGDAKPLPADLRLLEGEHKVVVSAKEHEDASATVTVKGGEPSAIVLDPKPKKTDAPPPPPPPEPEPEPAPGGAWFPYQGPIGLALAGTGAAVGGLGIGLLVYGSTLRGAASDNRDSHLASYGDACQYGDLTLCYYDTQLINRDGERAASAFGAGLGLAITGGVLLAAGITFVAAAPSLGSGEAPKADDGTPAKGPVSVACAPGVDAEGAGVLCGGTF